MMVKCCETVEARRGGKVVVLCQVHRKNLTDQETVESRR